ncbi:MAG: FAD-dependent oxidoreductase [Gammaproteobacteria bacterium]
MPQSTAGINRRTVIKALGSAPFLAAASGPVRALNKSDVIVIGAGLSGLNAALLLESAGLNVTVLEGRNRIGGRVQSLRNIPGNPEVGGTAFAPGYARLVDAANKYGVGLIDITPTIPFFFNREVYLNNQFIPQAEWPTSPLNPFPDAFKKAPPYGYFNMLMSSANPLETADDWLDPANAKYDISLHDWLRQIGQSEESIRLAYDTNPTHGMSAHDVSALMAMFAASFGGMQQKLTANNPVKGYTAKGGNQAIPEAMANALKNEVQLNTTVTGIRSNPDGVEVHCADGTVYRAGYAISSLPCSVLRRVKVDPIFTGAQDLAVRTLNSQIINQIHIVPKTPFWEKDGMSPNMFTDSLAGMVIAEHKGASPADITSLTVWLRGERAAWADQVDTQVLVSRSVLVRRLGYLCTGPGHEPDGRHRQSARPTAFLRRTHGRLEPRHGRRDGVGRASRAGNPIAIARRKPGRIITEPPEVQAGGPPRKRGRTVAGSAASRFFSNAVIAMAENAVSSTNNQLCGESEAPP